MKFQKILTILDVAKSNNHKVLYRDLMITTGASRGIIDYAIESTNAIISNDENGYTVIGF